MNNITLMGRLTAAPELKTTNSGKYVTAFSIAVDRGFADANGNRITDFIPCVAWGKTAEFINKYFGKGNMIAVVGSLQHRDYEDKHGNKRVAWEVIVNTADFCGKETAPDNRQNKTDINVIPEQDNVEDDDLPF